MWELDPQDGGRNLWKTLALAQPKGGYRLARAQPPSDETLERVFGPVPDTNDPNAGGLGVSPARLMAGQEWHLWDPYGRPATEDNCV
jgi:hypothetical protein